MGLRLTRRPGEAIILSGGIRIVYDGRNRAGQACIEIQAPRHIAALREEIARPEQRRTMGHDPSGVQIAREGAAAPAYRAIRPGEYVDTPMGPGTAEEAIPGASHLIGVHLHRSGESLAFDFVELRHLTPPEGQGQ